MGLQNFCPYRSTDIKPHVARTGIAHDFHIFLLLGIGPFFGEVLPDFRFERLDQVATGNAIPEPTCVAVAPTVPNFSFRELSIIFLASKWLQPDGYQTFSPNRLAQKCFQDRRTEDIKGSLPFSLTCCRRTCGRVRSRPNRSFGRYREFVSTRMKCDGEVIASSSCPRFIRLRKRAADRA